ncbi:hypothetical protein PAPYR_165 [Paratrimastix pyriformis]|uniref:Uncharacterized protein n=1 Tax=Paratrimastix pyriformis TaxID=342808 RepID=A0ABQ8UV15_9EUKA|nr:hypothetical protein PAPYR_165 [Paratrimastix pyriformis]
MYDKFQVKEALKSGNRMLYFAEIGGPTIATAQTLCLRGGAVSAILINATAVEARDIANVVNAIQACPNTLLIGVFEQSGDPYLKQKFDAGLGGAMIRAVESPEDISNFNGRLVFPPVGARPAGPSPASQYLGIFTDMVARAGQVTLSGISISTLGGLHNVTAIMERARATGVVDFVLVEAAALAEAMGVAPGSPSHRNALAAIESAAQGAGLALITRAATRSQASAAYDGGYRAAIIGSDQGALAAFLADFEDIPRNGTLEMGPGMQAGLLREALRAGQVVHIGFLMGADLALARQMADRMHGIFIDCEHGTFSRDEMRALIAGVLGTHTPNVCVRVGRYDHPYIDLALQYGANCIVCPSVNSGDEATRFLTRVRAAGPNITAVVMLETRQAVETPGALEDILRAGPDAILEGPYDLALSLNTTMGSDKHRAALDKIETATRIAAKGMATPSLAHHPCSQGNGDSIPRPPPLQPREWRLHPSPTTPAAKGMATPSLAHHPCSQGNGDSIPRPPALQPREWRLHPSPTSPAAKGMATPSLAHHPCSQGNGDSIPRPPPLQPREWRLHPSPTTPAAKGMATPSLAHQPCSQGNGDSIPRPPALQPREWRLHPSPTTPAAKGMATPSLAHHPCSQGNGDSIPRPPALQPREWRLHPSPTTPAAKGMATPSLAHHPCSQGNGDSIPRPPPLQPREWRLHPSPTSPAAKGMATPSLAHHPCSQGNGDSIPRPPALQPREWRLHPSPTTPAAKGMATPSLAHHPCSQGNGDSIPRPPALQPREWRLHPSPTTPAAKGMATPSLAHQPCSQGNGDSIPRPPASHNTHPPRPAPPPASRWPGVPLGAVATKRSVSYQKRQLGFQYLTTVSDQESVVGFFGARFFGSGAEATPPAHFVLPTALAAANLRVPTALAEAGTGFSRYLDAVALLQDRLPWTAQGALLTKQFHFADAATVRLVWKRATSAGQSSTTTSPAGKILLMLRGNCLLQVGAVTQALGPGDVAMVPAGVAHTVTDLTGTMELAEIMLPHRPAQAP